MRKQIEVTIIHVFKDGTVSDTTEGRTVPAEIVERIAQIAAKCKKGGQHCEDTTHTTI